MSARPPSPEPPPEGENEVQRNKLGSAAEVQGVLPADLLQ